MRRWSDAADFGRRSHRLLEDRRVADALAAARARARASRPATRSLYNAGLAAARLGRDAEALAHLDDVAADDSHATAALALRAEIERRAGDLDAAVTTLERVRALRAATTSTLRHAAVGLATRCSKPAGSPKPGSSPRSCSAELDFALLAAPGSDPGAARSRACRIVTVDGPADVAAAARAAREPYLLLLAPGARAAAGRLRRAARGARRRASACWAARRHAAGERHFGWMLAPAAGPLPFELAPSSPPRARPAPMRWCAARSTWSHRGCSWRRASCCSSRCPPSRVAALSNSARARARPAATSIVPARFACEAPAAGLDDRGRAAALRALAERRPELVGAHRLPPAVRRVGVERELRLEGGRRVRIRRPMPPLTVLVHGPGAEHAARRARDLAPRGCARSHDPAAALRAELRVRGRPLRAGRARRPRVPDAAEFDALVEALGVGAVRRARRA